MPDRLSPFIIGSFLLLLPCLSSAEYVLSKRTISSSNGALDAAFFSEFFGATDPSSTHDAACLDRWLEHAAPDNIGIHFPTSHQTPDVPVLSSGKNSTMRLSDWDRYRVALHNASAQVIHPQERADQPD